MIGLKVSDIFSDKMQFKEYFILKEKKTGKEKKIKLNDSIKKCLKSFIAERNLTYTDYLFPSRVGGHIKRIQAWKVLKKAATEMGIENFVPFYAKDLGLLDLLLLVSTTLKLFKNRREVEKGYKVGQN